MKEAGPPFVAMKRYRKVSNSQRDMVTQSRRLDALDLPNAFDKLLIELMRLGYSKPAALDRTECHCQYVIYAKTRIGLRQTPQALEREPGHHEHDRGKSNLRRHQNLAES